MTHDKTNPPESLTPIAITMGDPAGVGPELCLKLLTEPRVRNVCIPIIFGDARLLRKVAERLDLAMPAQIFSIDTPDLDLRKLREPAILDFQQASLATIEPGKIQKACGEAAFAYIDRAISEAMHGHVSAVVTAPINKEAIHLAGYDYPGHTEIFIEKTESQQSCMMLTSGHITAALVTTHVGINEVPGLISTERVLETIELAAEAMHQLRGRRPKLIVCGLNPHAGEHGLFGRNEEEEIIIPAIERAREKGIDVEGPLPPDTAFLPERLTKTDAHICMYHDQGLIPLKMLAFDTAVNVTLGLPIVRTSPDHGTAMDIAWQGIAMVESMVHAVLTAARLAGIQEKDLQEQLGWSDAK